MSGADIHVAALVLHFRTPERTLACLRSLVTEGVRHVVVVDNSEDEGRSVALMRDGLVELLRGGMNVELSTPGVNLGFARGVSEGLSRMDAHVAEHVLLINSDACLEKGALHPMVSALDGAPFVVPMVRADNTSMVVPLMGFYQKALALVLRRSLWGSIHHPSGCCLLIRQGCARPGLFDEDFFFYGEDTMLGFVLQRQGIAVAQCDEAVVRHATSSSAGNGSMFYEYHMNRAHWLLARKLACNRLEFVAFVGLRCMTLPLRATVRSIRSGSLVPWRGLCAATVDVFAGRCRSFTPPSKEAEGRV